MLNYHKKELALRAAFRVMGGEGNIERMRKARMSELAIDHEGLKLKVMRLYKPALHVERGGEVVSDL